MRICIVTPGQLGSNPRVVKEAATLAGAGHEVTVVCAKLAAFVELRDQAVMREARFRIVRVAFDHPVAWRAARLLQETARTAFFRLGIAAAATHAISPMTPALRRATLRHRADLYIAHYPAALPAAAAAAARFGALYAFDAEDFHLGDLPDAPEHDAEKRLIRTVEAKHLHGAAYVTAAAPLIAAAYAETYGIPLPHTVLNAFPKGQAATTPTPAGDQQPGPSLYWFSQVIGPGRGLEDAVRAAAIMHTRVHLYFRGTPARGYVPKLKALASSLDMAARLHLLEPIEPQCLERDGAHFDIGYAGDQTETLNRQIALTNKLFSYLSSGLPVIATSIPSHRDILPQLGDAMTLVPLGNPKALAAALDELLSDPERLAERRRHSWQLGQTRFAWEAEVDGLLSLVQGAVNGGRVQAGAGA